MPLTAAQRTISENPARFRVAVCGRRFGKTYLAMTECAKVVRYPGRRVYVVYPTYRQARTVLWETLKSRLQRVRWLERVNETDLTCTLRNGSQISLRGADNFDSLRGVGLDAVILDEFQLIDQRAWTEVLRPTLSTTGGSALFIGTPSGTTNWAFDLFQRGQDPTESNWESFSFTTIEGGRVSEEEIEQARRDLDERTFRQEYLATFENYQNRVFYAFDRKLHVRPFDANTPGVIHVGLDFNVGQMSASIFAQNTDTVHLFDEIALTSSNTQEVVDELRTRYPRTKIFVYPDPAGSARKTSADSGVTDHTILANAGFVVKAPRAHTPVRDGINAVNSRLQSAAGEVRFWVAPHCRHSIESLEKHSYKAGTSVPDKDSGFDHFADSIRYYIDYVFPIRREVDPYETRPQRWGHQSSVY